MPSWRVRPPSAACQSGSRVFSFRVSYVDKTTDASFFFSSQTSVVSMSDIDRNMDQAKPARKTRGFQIEFGGQTPASWFESLNRSRTVGLLWTDSFFIYPVRTRSLAAVGHGLPYHNSTGPMDKRIRQIHIQRLPYP